MLKRTMIITLASAIALSSGAALAQGRGNGNGRDNPSNGAPPPGLANRPGALPPGQAKKAWALGERLPRSYLTTRYYITDYSRYQLREPPQGYRWVMVDDQAYLVQTQTGFISQLVTLLLGR